MVENLEHRASQNLSPMAKWQEDYGPAHSTEIWPGPNTTRHGCLRAHASPSPNTELCRAVSGLPLRHVAPAQHGTNISGTIKHMASTSTNDPFYNPNIYFSLLTSPIPVPLGARLLFSVVTAASLPSVHSGLPCANVISSKTTTMAGRGRAGHRRRRQRPGRR